MRFEKGKSGNPGGRPKGFVDVQFIARHHTLDAIATLRQICNNRRAPPAARVSAATALLDRGWGKPRQEVDLNHRDVSVAQMTDEELDDRITRLLAGEKTSPGMPEKFSNVVH